MRILSQAEQYPWRTAMAWLPDTVGTPEKPVKIYRGLRLQNLPPELTDAIHRYTQMPLEESEVGQHMKLGPMLLDHIENGHWERQRGWQDQETGEMPGMGRHWTNRKDFAETAASPQVGPGYPVVIGADWDGSGHDPNNHGEDATTMQTEGEVTMRPGHPMNVTNVWIPNTFGDSRWLEVLDDPHQATRMAEYGVPYTGGPQQRRASSDMVKMVHFTTPEKAKKILRDQRFVPWAESLHDPDFPPTDDELYNFFTTYDNRNDPDFKGKYGNVGVVVEVPRNALKSDSDWPHPRSYMVHQRDLAGRPIQRLGRD